MTSPPPESDNFYILPGRNDSVKPFLKVFSSLPVPDAAVSCGDSIDYMRSSPNLSTSFPFFCDLF
jgi:hypothetical protein